jgi:hypothetical protein
MEFALKEPPSKIRRRMKHFEKDSDVPSASDLSRESDPTPAVQATTLSEANFAFLGIDEPEALCVIYPPTRPCCKDTNKRIAVSGDTSSSSIVSKLAQVERIFKQKSTLSYLKKVVKRGYNKDCRLIQAERFEVFVKADKYGSTVWNSILQRGGFQDPTAFTEELVHYVVTMAKKDPRIRKEEDWIFENFSLILTYSNVPGQEPHIDLLFPNFQFGLIISDSSPTTQYYEIPKCNQINSGKDLAQLWLKIDSSIPDQLVQFLAHDPDVNNKLEFYGGVFSVATPCPSEEDPKKHMFTCHEIKSVPCGTLLSLPGSKVHAGPPTASPFRAVLFCSGRPSVSYGSTGDESNKGILLMEEKSQKKALAQSESYDPDSQYSSVILMSSILFILWRQYGITKESRVYLLKRLRMYVESTILAGTRWNTVRWYRHFPLEKEFQAMLKAMESRVLEEEKLDKQRALSSTSSSSCETQSDGTFWDEFYSTYVEDDSIAPLHVESMEYVGEFRLISDPDLHVEYNGRYHPATLFHRQKDDRTVIYYRDSNEWEGSRGNDHYRLQWYSFDDDTQRQKKEGALKFNGLNGQVCDNNGDILQMKTISETETG